MSLDFLVNKHSLKTTKWLERPEQLGPALQSNEIRLRIEHFALTSNNVTYASFGESMNYWGFFPTPPGHEGWGRIPVWGFATVTHIGSDLALGEPSEVLALGERVYGYFPMSNELVVTPVQLNALGFSDGAKHRESLHPVYNHYRRCQADPSYQADREAQQMLLQPLFMTAFLIDDFLADQQFFGAQQIILSSASSKTAYATAHQLKLRKGIKVIGLTSPNNAVFVHGLGCYDKVLTYSELDQLDTGKKAVLVDMAGNAELRSSIHQRFGDTLTYSCSVGGTHWEALSTPGQGSRIAGPKPTLFFAPAQIKKRNADWGSKPLQVKMADAWRAFLPVLDQWMHVVAGRGPEAVEQVYAALLKGQSKADQGYTLSLE
jgi:Protein of unknown function (DUF2855)